MSACLPVCLSACGHAPSGYCCSEEQIALAILRLVELEKAVVEGAGATGLAAVLAGLLPELKGQK